MEKTTEISQSQRLLMVTPAQVRAQVGAPADAFVCLVDATTSVKTSLAGSFVSFLPTKATMGQWQIVHLAKNPGFIGS
jgi:hypothetical protein